MADLLEVKGLEVKYHTSAGTLTALHRYRLPCTARRNCGGGGRIWLPIDHHSRCCDAAPAAQWAHYPGPGIISKNQDLCTASPEELRNLRGRDISMVFQDAMTSLNPVFNIRTQMLDILAAHHPGISRASLLEKAIAMLDRVGIPRSSPTNGSMITPTNTPGECASAS